MTHSVCGIRNFLLIVWSYHVRQGSYKVIQGQQPNQCWFARRVGLVKFGPKDVEENIYEK